MNSLPTFATYALEFINYKYLLIFIGTVIEWPILMVACGFLLKLWVFNIVPLYLSILLWDLFWDVLWYCVWRYFLDTFLLRFWRYFWVDLQLINSVKILFQKYHTKILFISKITIGFGAALVTLVVAGASHIPFKKYITINLLGEFILVATLFLIGYLFWNLYTQVSDAFRYSFIVAMIILVPIIIYSISHYFKNKILDQWSHL